MNKLKIHVDLSELENFRIALHRTIQNIEINISNNEKDIDETKRRYNALYETIKEQVNVIHQKVEEAEDEISQYMYHTETINESVLHALIANKNRLLEKLDEYQHCLWKTEDEYSIFSEAIRLKTNEIQEHMYRISQLLKKSDAFVFAFCKLVRKSIEDIGDETNGKALLNIENSVKYKGISGTKLSRLNYKPIEYVGSVKVHGELRDVSRRVYQRNDIDIHYVDEATGLTNLKRMQKGKPPIGLDGNPIQLHHILQKEAGQMVEIQEITHQEYFAQLHGLMEDGASFRNDPILNKQYNNFRNQYWKWRASQFIGG